MPMPRALVSIRTRMAAAALMLAAASIVAGAPQGMRGDRPEDPVGTFETLACAAAEAPTDAQRDAALVELRALVAAHGDALSGAQACGIGVETLATRKQGGEWWRGQFQFRSRGGWLEATFFAAGEAALTGIADLGEAMGAGPVRGLIIDLVRSGGDAVVGLLAALLWGSGFWIVWKLVGLVHGLGGYAAGAPPLPPHGASRRWKAEPESPEDAAARRRRRHFRRH